MTAPSATRSPLPAACPSAAQPRSRRARRLAGLAAVLLMSAAASGCMTVNGRTALIPSATKAAARAALQRFVKTSNEANTRLDPALNPQVESGSLLAVDGSYIRQSHTLRPAGDPGYNPLALSDTHYLIPRQVGWPKWFAVDTATNRGNRWLLLFTHDSPAQPWTASYLLMTGDAPDLSFATDSQGYAVPEPLAGTRLAVQPGEVATRYKDYQHSGAGAARFAPGPYTTKERSARVARLAPHAGVATQFADEAGGRHYPPVALRLRNGDALVFFTTQYQWKTTVAGGMVVSPEVTAMLTSPVHTSVTRYIVSEQGAIVPPAGGEIQVVGQVSQLVEARGA